MGTQGKLEALEASLLSEEAAAESRVPAEPESGRGRVRGALLAAG